MFSSKHLYLAFDLSRILIIRLMYRFIMLFAKVILTAVAVLYGELGTKAALDILLYLSYFQLGFYNMG